LIWITSNREAIAVKLVSYREATPMIRLIFLTLLLAGAPAQAWEDTMLDGAATMMFYNAQCHKPDAKMAKAADFNILPSEQWKFPVSGATFAQLAAEALREGARNNSWWTQDDKENAYDFAARLDLGSYFLRAFSPEKSPEEVWSDKPDDLKRLYQLIDQQQDRRQDEAGEEPSPSLHSEDYEFPVNAATFNDPAAEALRAAPEYFYGGPGKREWTEQQIKDSKVWTDWLNRSADELRDNPSSPEDIWAAYPEPTTNMLGQLYQLMDEEQDVRQDEEEDYGKRGRKDEPSRAKVGLRPEVMLEWDREAERRDPEVERATDEMNAAGLWEIEDPDRVSRKVAAFLNGDDDLSEAPQLKARLEEACAVISNANAKGLIWASSSSSRSASCSAS
jgi:hypothetical protein